eukprot:1725463-Rhodomonas_salina.1
MKQRNVYPDQCESARNQTQKAAILRQTVRKRPLTWRNLSALEAFRKGHFRVPLHIPDGDLKVVCVQDVSEVPGAPVVPTFKVNLRLVAKRGQ